MQGGGWNERNLHKQITCSHKFVSICATIETGCSTRSHQLTLHGPSGLPGTRCSTCNVAATEWQSPLPKNALPTHRENRVAASLRGTSELLHQVRRHSYAPLLAEQSCHIRCSGIATLRFWRNRAATPGAAAQLRPGIAAFGNMELLHQPQRPSSLPLANRAAAPAAAA